MAKIADIEGIGPVYAEKLIAAGIKTVEALLEKGATPNGRKAIAEETGIDGGKILSWTNMADLFRIKGVAGEYAELLHAAGIDTVKELRNRIPANLHAKMQEVNDEKGLVRQAPSPAQVEAWVAQAKELPPVMEY
jgi:predicted flap endonuclease-1-like 5' DNA nuclease